MAEGILLEWLEEEGYHVEEPDDHTVELWHKERLVARSTPVVSRATLNQLAMDDVIAHPDLASRRRKL